MTIISKFASLLKSIIVIKEKELPEMETCSFDKSDWTPEELVWLNSLTPLSFSNVVSLEHLSVTGGSCYKKASKGGRFTPLKKFGINIAKYKNTNNNETTYQISIIGCHPQLNIFRDSIKALDREMITVAPKDMKDVLSRIFMSIYSIKYNDAPYEVQQGSTSIYCYNKIYHQITRDAPSFRAGRDSV